MAYRAVSVVMGMSLLGVIVAADYLGILLLPYKNPIVEQSPHWANISIVISTMIVSHCGRPWVVGREAGRWSAGLLLLLIGAACSGLIWSVIEILRQAVCIKGFDLRGAVITAWSLTGLSVVFLIANIWLLLPVGVSGIWLLGMAGRKSSMCASSS